MAKKKGAQISAHIAEAEREGALALLEWPIFLAMQLKRLEPHLQDSETGVELIRATHEMAAVVTPSLEPARQPSFVPQASAGSSSASEADDLGDSFIQGALGNQVVDDIIPTPQGVDLNSPLVTGNMDFAGLGTRPAPWSQAVEQTTPEPLAIPSSPPSTSLFTSVKNGNIAVVDPANQVKPLTPQIVFNPTPSDEVQLVGMRVIRWDGGTQARVNGVDEATAQGYAELERNGKELPPITLFFDGVNYWPADGFHRGRAHEILGREGIRAYVRPGTRSQAILFGISANGSHGLRYTNEDKRNAVRMILLDLEMSVNMTDKEIALKVAVDPKTVGNIRKQMVASGEIPDFRNGDPVLAGSKRSTGAVTAAGGRDSSSSTVSRGPRSSRLRTGS